MDSRTLTLLQWCDSNFPSGAFSHSFGLETYIQEGSVDRKASFQKWLKVYLDHQLVTTDGLACRLTYDALERDQWKEIWELDRLITVQNVPQESREGSRKMGVRMLQLAMDLHVSPIFTAYHERIKNSISFGHPALVFAMMAFWHHIPRLDTLLAYLYASLSSLIQNGVRGIPLGQTDGQLLLIALQPSLLKAVEKIEGLDPSELGAVPPGLELAQIRHERLNYRLFMS